MRIPRRRFLALALPAAVLAAGCGPSAADSQPNPDLKVPEVKPRQPRGAAPSAGEEKKK